MQFLLGVVTALVIVIGAVCFFIKHHQLSILFVARDKKSPIFLQSKDLKTSDFIQVHYASIGALGTISNPNKYSAELMASLLQAKDKELLQIVMKKHFSDQFIASQINRSIITLLNILDNARDSRRISNIDDTIEVIREYINDCKGYWSHKSFYPNKSYIPNFTAEFVRRKLKWSSTKDTHLKDIYEQCYKPWQKDV